MNPKHPLSLPSIAGQNIKRVNCAEHTYKLNVTNVEKVSYHKA